MVINSDQFFSVPASPLKRQLAEANRERAWTLHCQGLPNWRIGKELGVTTSQAQKYVAAIRSRHPAAKMTDEEKFVESYEVLREVGLLFRQEISRARAEGEPVQALLASLSTHSDRYGRFLTKQSAVPTVEVNASFNSDLWAGLMGAVVPAAPLADAAVGVEVLPAGDAHSNGAEPSPGVTALNTGTPG